MTHSESQASTLRVGAMPAYYHSIIERHLNQRRPAWLAGMNITNMAGRLVIIARPLAVQLPAEE